MSNNVLSCIERIFTLSTEKLEWVRWKAKGAASIEFLQGDNKMIYLAFKPVGGISSPYKIFIDNVFLGKIKPNETKNIVVEDGAHFISFRIIKKWDIFSYSYKFNVKKSNDIYLELRGLNWLNGILVFCAGMSGTLFPKIPRNIRYISIVIIIVIMNYAFQSLIFKKPYYKKHES